LSNQNPPVQQNGLTIDKLIEAVNNTRDDILRKQSDSDTTTITGYDGLTRHLQSALTQMGNLEKEVIRLQELCKTNNINYAIPPVSPIIQPHPTTQEISIPPKVETPVPDTSKA